jgi:nitroimidazol reductase NimA-like FMN-containing flavoprotein (pyridoxamine 5'-phosphate oxidase superfamily)
VTTTVTKEEAYEFLDSHPGWLILSTVGKDGYPHSVPLGYFRMGDEIYVGARSRTQRAKNVERNPRVSALVESGRTMQDIKGLLIQGDADVISRPEEVLPLMRESARHRGTPEEQLPTEPRPGVTYIRVRPRRFIPWGFSRS